MRIACHEASARHESVPGHHLDISSTNDNLFSKTTSIIEEWALYAERLSPYDSSTADLLREKYPGWDTNRQKYSYIGSLYSELLRAVRLVVDSSIHDNSFTQSEAINFMKKYTILSEDDIKSQVLRYSANPGQALAYKLGEICIKEYRNLCDCSSPDGSALVNSDRVRKFHDVVLKSLDPTEMKEKLEELFLKVLPSPEAIIKSFL